MSLSQRLARDTRELLAPAVICPTYDRDKQKVGIVHFGIGAFHRAHQAMYTDAAMNAGDSDWSIVGVSLRSPDVRNQLEPQNGLYTLVERSTSEKNICLIGAVKSILVAPENPQAIIDALVSPDVHIVSFTITEKGYCRSTQGDLNLDAADISNDLDKSQPPRTIYGFLARAFLQRKRLAHGGLTLMSCDNLAHNGKQLAHLLLQFIERFDHSLVEWFKANCTCPSTMVDRIVPATTDDNREEVLSDIGLRDEAVVLTESFCQWVVEDRFAGPRPRWEVGGAQFVTNVEPYEMAKLRMLNGAHSALAYLGLSQGYIFVHEAIADRAIRTVIEKIMRVEAAASLPDSEIDTNAYADALLIRFENTALAHRLSQIAMDGSQKIPQRWLQSLAINEAAGKECPATLSALAAWITYVRGDTHEVNDPMAAQLALLWKEQGRNEIVTALFGSEGLFRTCWVASDNAQKFLTDLLPA